MPISPISGRYDIPPPPPPSNGSRSQLTNMERMVLTDLFAELEKLLQAAKNHKYNPASFLENLKAFEQEIQKILDAKPPLSPSLQQIFQKAESGVKQVIASIQDGTTPGGWVNSLNAALGPVARIFVGPPP